MRKIIFSVLLFVSFPSYAQDFLTNPNCVYGEGRGNTIEEADKAALAALSNTLRVQVKTASTYQVVDENGEISRFYKQNVEIASTVTLKDCYLFIDDTFTDSGYRVFRYINKEEYVFNRQTLVKQLLSREESASYIVNGKTLNSSRNLILGRLYYAYQILDDDLMSLFDYRNDVVKENIKQKALRLQQSTHLEETTALYFGVDETTIPIYGRDVDNIKRPCFDMNYIYIEIRQPSTYNLDFEFWDGTKWSNAYEKSITPSCCEMFSNLCRIKCTSSFPRNKFTMNNRGYYKEGKVPTLPRQLKFRVLFQTVDMNGNKIKIDVPDDWYAINEVSMALPRDIKKDLDLDIERGYITREQAGKIWFELYGK